VDDAALATIIAALVGAISVALARLRGRRSGKLNTLKEELEVLNLIHFSTTAKVDLQAHIINGLEYYCRARPSRDKKGIVLAIGLIIAGLTIAGMTVLGQAGWWSIAGIVAGGLVIVFGVVNLVENMTEIRRDERGRPM